MKKYVKEEPPAPSLIWDHLLSFSAAWFRPFIGIAIHSMRGFFRPDAILGGALPVEDQMILLESQYIKYT